MGIIGSCRFSDSKSAGHSRLENECEKTEIFAMINIDFASYLE